MNGLIAVKLPNLTVSVEGRRQGFGTGGVSWVEIAKNAALASHACFPISINTKVALLAFFSCMKTKRYVCSLTDKQSHDVPACFIRSFSTTPKTKVKFSCLRSGAALENLAAG